MCYKKKRFLNYLPEACWNLSSSRLDYWYVNGYIFITIRTNECLSAHVKHSFVLKLTQKLKMKYATKKRFLNYLPEACWNLSSFRLYHLKQDHLRNLHEIELFRIRFKFG